MAINVSFPLSDLISKQILKHLKIYYLYLVYASIKFQVFSFFLQALQIFHEFESN